MFFCEIGEFSFILSFRENINMFGVCGLCPHLPSYECANIPKNRRTVIKIIIVSIHSPLFQEFDF